MIMEAVMLKFADEEKKAQEQNQQRAWKKDEEGLNNLKNIAGG